MVLSFDFNQFLPPLTQKKVFIIEKKKSGDFSAFIDLPPFGVLWYREQVNKKELAEKLEFYEKEFERSKLLLENSNFCQKAPPQLVAEEKKKLDYYREKKKKLAAE